MSRASKRRESRTSVLANGQSHRYFEIYVDERRGSTDQINALIHRDDLVDLVARGLDALADATKGEKEAVMLSAALKLVRAALKPA